MKIYNRKKYFNFYTYTIIFHILILHVNCDWLIDCGACRCKWNSGKKTADCKNMTISMIPNDLSSELQVLDLSYNHITLIENNAFLNADLKNLHKLFIRHCSLEHIESDAFNSLEILIELDLSNNLIKILSKNIFVHLVKVRSIVLNNNLIETLNDGLFCNLKYLHKIELKNNQIHTIGINVFINLPFLSQIFLNDNKLKFLRKETFENLKRLASLSLDSNPWNCTCELQSFREYVIKHNLYTPPTSCQYPINIRGILWTDQNQPEAFACKPKIIYPSRGASINTSKENVTLICRVHASPNTLIAWDYNKQMYSNNYHQARVHIQLLREDLHDTNSNSYNNNNNNNDMDMDNINYNSNNNNNNNYNKDIEKEIGRDVFISRLTIIGAEKSDEGTYTCFAENPGGKDEVQMNLLVQKHNHQNLLFQNNLIIIICLMVLGLLSASIFLAMITCCIYKRFKTINQLSNNENDTNHHLHHHHHHLENHQKSNFINSINGGPSYHHYHQNNETTTSTTTTAIATATTDIKQNDNLSDQINTFTDLKEVNNLYNENDIQGSLQKHPQRYDDTAHNYNQQEQHKYQQLSHPLDEAHMAPISTEHQYSPEQLNSGSGGNTVEFQPDLLPYIPPQQQSASLGFAEKQQSSYDINQQMNYYHHHPLKQQQHFQYHSQQQKQHLPHQKEDQVINDLQYVNSYIGRDTFNTVQYKGERELNATTSIRNRSGSNNFISDEFMNNDNSIDSFIPPVGKIIIAPSSKSMTGSSTTLVTTKPMNNYETTLLRRGAGFNPGACTSNGIHEDSTSSRATATSSSSSSAEVFLRHESTVRTSPSLNFLSNFHSRRELL